MADQSGRGARGGGSSADVLGFTEPAFVLLRDLIAQRTGVHFAPDKRDLLADKLADLLAAQGMTSYLDYYYLLRYDADAERHWRELANRLAVPETYFWRQPDQIVATAGVLAARHIARNPSAPFRIWSAACCSGEEPLSIAIALAEAGILDRHPVELVARDASEAMLARARLGVYGERSFRTLSPQLRERYFRAESGGWRIDPAIHARVRFTRANLVDSREVVPLASADVVFCRNVLIYFSDDTVAQVARSLAAGMPEHAHLCLGASESLTRVSSAFDLVEVGGAFMYTKQGATNGAGSAGAVSKTVRSARESR
jgi:chemotaxis protein methyltransferase CheR